jgi:rhamnosyl/mannosyltransferase
VYVDPKKKEAAMMIQSAADNTGVPQSSDRLPILLLGKFYPPTPGGVEEVFRVQCQMLGSSFSVTALVHSSDSISRHDVDGEVEVIRAATYGYIKSQPISPSLALPLIFRKFRIVHLHWPNVLGCILLLVFQRKARLIVSHHSEIMGFGLLGVVSTWFYRLLLRKADAVIVLSKKNLEAAPSLEGFRGRIAAIPTCVDEAAFHATESILHHARVLRQSHAKDRVVVSAVGRLVPYKGIDVLLEAVAAVPDIVCFIAGDGPERLRLERRARELGLDGRCIFFGSVDKKMVHTILRATDIFVLPSVSSGETFGVCQVEAQVCEVPVIASDIPTGVTEVTLAGRTGICVPPRDKDALATAISKLASNKRLRQAYGRAGRAHAARHFSFSEVQGLLLRLYRDVLQAERCDHSSGRFGSVRVNTP